MLRIRFVRAGKKKQPFFRIVVAEHSKPIKGRFIEVLGHYNPMSQDVSIKEDRIKYWISNGAQPSDSAAALFKKEGMDDMDKFMDPRDKKRKKKGEEEAPAEEAPKAEAPSEEKAEDAPAPEEKPAEEAAPEAPAEEPAKEETPADEPKEEEKPAEEPKEEPTPAEEPAAEESSEEEKSE